MHGSSRPGTAPIATTREKILRINTTLDRSQSSRSLRSPMHTSSLCSSRSRPSTSGGRPPPSSGVTSLQLSALIESVERLSTAQNDIQHTYAKIEAMSRSKVLANRIKAENLLELVEVDEACLSSLWLGCGCSQAML